MRLTSAAASVSIHLFNRPDTGAQGRDGGGPRMTAPPTQELAYGKRRALNEMHSIFVCQWSNGMLPQIRFVPGPSGEEGSYRPGPDDWGVTPTISGPTRLRTSGITQPPIMGLCVHDIFLKFTEAERSAHIDSFL